MPGNQVRPEGGFVLSSGTMDLKTLHIKSVIIQFIPNLATIDISCNYLAHS